MVPIAYYLSGFKIFSRIILYYTYLSLFKRTVTLKGYRECKAWMSPSGGNKSRRPKVNELPENWGFAPRNREIISFFPKKNHALKGAWTLFLADVLASNILLQNWTGHAY